MVTLRSSTVLYHQCVQAGGHWDARSIGAFLQSIRERQGLKRSVVAAALDMGEQNIRYYEAGRNRLAADDIPRFATAYRMTAEERQQLARALGLLHEDADRPVTDEERTEYAELQKLVTTNYVSLLEDNRMENLTPSEFRLLLNMMRASMRTTFDAIREQREE